MEWLSGAFGLSRVDRLVIKIHKMINNQETNTELVANGNDLMTKSVGESLFSADIFFGQLCHSGVRNEVAGATNGLSIERRENVG